MNLVSYSYRVGILGEAYDEIDHDMGHPARTGSCVF